MKLKETRKSEAASKRFGNHEDELEKEYTLFVACFAGGTVFVDISLFTYIWRGGRLQRL